MAVDFYGYWCRLLLEFFNMIFAVIGLVVTCLGFCSSQAYAVFNLDINSRMLIIGVFAAGALMLLVAILGHVGVSTESRAALGIVSVLLVVLCAAEVGAGVLAFVNKDKVAHNLSELYKTVYMQYMKKGDQREAIVLHIFHYTLNCCGNGGVLELFVRNTCRERNGFWDAVNTPSCVTAISNLFASNAPIVLGFFIGIAMLLIVVIIGVIATIAGMYVHVKLGHCFTCTEYKSALGVALLGVVCGAPITAGVLVYVNNMLAYSLSEMYKTIYIQYMNRRDQNEAIALQNFHNVLNCCGMGGPLEPFVRDTCPEKSGIWDVLKTSSCVTAISNLFATNAPIVLGFFIGIALLMIVALICCCYFSHSIVVNEDPCS